MSFVNENNDDKKTHLLTVRSAVPHFLQIAMKFSFSLATAFTAATILTTTGQSVVMGSTTAPLEVKVVEVDGATYPIPVITPMIDDADSPLVYQYDHATSSIDGQMSLQNGEIHVVNGILTEEELRKYNALASNAQQHDNTSPGRAKADALIEPDLIRRIHALVGIDVDNNSIDGPNGSSSQRKLYENGAMVTVSKLTSDLPMHKDHHAADKAPVLDLVGFISLKESDSVFVWDDGVHKIPLKENSMVIFHGNHTHGIPLSKGDEVRFLGPFALNGFTEVGGPFCECAVPCNERRLFQTGPTSGVEIEVTCDDELQGEVCLDFPPGPPEIFIFAVIVDITTGAFCFSVGPQDALTGCTGLEVDIEETCFFGGICSSSTEGKKGGKKGGMSMEDEEMAEICTPGGIGFPFPCGPVSARELPLQLQAALGNFSAPQAENDTTAEIED